MADDEQENGDAKEQTLEDKVEAVAKKSSIQFWVAIGFIPLMLITFVVGVLFLGNAHKVTSGIVAEEPINKIDIFAKKIAAVKLKAEKQYAKYHSKMENDAILSVNEKFRIMYELSEESEKDYTYFLEQYQKLAYDSASRVKGSGQWYYYYDQKLSKLVSRAQQREKNLLDYLQEE